MLTDVRPTSVRLPSEACLCSSPPPWRPYVAAFFPLYGP
jgi:hypothetical protein